MSAESRDHTALAATRRGVLARTVDAQRRPLGALVFFLVMMAVFFAANPRVFMNPAIYAAVFVSMPLLAILAVSLVFVVVSGEIDLSFGSVVGMGGWTFAVVVKAGWGPLAAFGFALAVGAVCGIVNGWLVTRLKLSSLVSTLGMNFLLRGLINIGNQGFGTPLNAVTDSTFSTILVGSFHGVPMQVLWGIVFVAVAWGLFNRHRFGAQVCCVGDNEDSAREMGINVARVKGAAFVLVGIAAAIVGVMSGLINTTFYPTAGDGYLLLVLAAVFVGGTPTWGGTGTIVGAAIGAAVMSFIETGVVAARLTGFYTQFFFGLIMILSIVSHRFNRSKSRL